MNNRQEKGGLIIISVCVHQSDRNKEKLRKVSVDRVEICDGGGIDSSKKSVNSNHTAETVQQPLTNSNQL